MPTDLLTVWEGREIWRSLDTDSYAMALRRIHRVAADVEAAFEKVRCSIGRAIDTMLLVASVSEPAISTPLVPAAPQPPAPPSPSSTRTIGDVYDRFIADPKHQWSKRTRIAHATTRKWVAEVYGEETPLADVTREGCRAFLALLRDMPRSAHQRFSDMTIMEVIVAAKAKGEFGGLDAAVAARRRPPVPPRSRAKSRLNDDGSAGTIAGFPIEAGDAQLLHCRHRFVLARFGESDATERCLRPGHARRFLRRGLVLHPCACHAHSPSS